MDNLRVSQFAAGALFHPWYGRFPVRKLRIVSPWSPIQPKFLKDSPWEIGKRFFSVIIDLAVLNFDRSPYRDFPFRRSVVFCGENFSSLRKLRDVSNTGVGGVGDGFSFYRDGIRDVTSGTGFSLPLFFLGHLIKWSPRSSGVLRGSNYLAWGVMPLDWNGPHVSRKLYRKCVFAWVCFYGEYFIFLHIDPSNSLGRRLRIALPRVQKFPIRVFGLYPRFRESTPGIVLGILLSTGSSIPSHR